MSGASSFILQPVLYFGDDIEFTFELVIQDGSGDLRIHARKAGDPGRFATLVFSDKAAEAWRETVLYVERP